LGDSKVTHATNKESHLGKMTNFQMRSTKSENAESKVLLKTENTDEAAARLFTHDVEHCRDRSERPRETVFGRHDASVGNESVSR
jgi:hypothetical protein